MIWSVVGLAALAMAPAACLAGTAQALPPWTPHCYDAEVVGRVISQTPTPVRAGPGEIVFEWPWELDLDVREVRVGKAPVGPIKVLAVMHTYRRLAGEVTWLLRRTSDERFNIVAFKPDDRVARCKAGEPPDRPFSGFRDLELRWRAGPDGTLLPPLP